MYFKGSRHNIQFYVVIVAFYTIRIYYKIDFIVRIIEILRYYFFLSLPLFSILGLLSMLSIYNFHYMQICLCDDRRSLKILDNISKALDRAPQLVSHPLFVLR